MKLKNLLFVLFLSCLVSCTTATYGNKFEKSQGSNGLYTFKVYTGGFAGIGTAREKFEIKVSSFMASNGFTSYKMVSETWVPFPLSGVEYSVIFE